MHEQNDSYLQWTFEKGVAANRCWGLLNAKLDVIGLSVPGMPMGSPGMEGAVTEPYEVLAFSADGERMLFARH